MSRSAPCTQQPRRPLIVRVPAPSALSLSQVLFSQGFGTRRACDALIRAGRVHVDSVPVLDPDATIATTGLVFSVDGVPWPYHARAVIALNKPAGHECSQKPSHHPSVLSLLPPPLRVRGVQPIGRLDADTTGLLLLTDDGALLHRLTSPRHHVPKVYEVQCADPVTAAQVALLEQGVVLRDDPRPVRAQALQVLGERALTLTLTEGKYHQVKRMIAAAGNHVERLHRLRFGALTLPAELAPGQWCWVDAASITS